MPIESTAFWMVCSIIVLLGSTLSSVAIIYNFFKKPAKKYKEKQDMEFKQMIKDTLTETLPEMLMAHDLETRDRYRADRERYLEEIRDSVLHETEADLAQIALLKTQYETLTISTRDVLREKIIKIYTDNRISRSITVLEKEKLEQFYKDYKAVLGNSYIDKYYKRMCTWKVVEDDDDYDDDII